MTKYGTPLTADQMTSTMKATVGPDGALLRQRFHREDEHRYVTPEGDSFCRRDFF